MHEFLDWWLDHVCVPMLVLITTLSLPLFFIMLVIIVFRVLFGV